MTHPTTWIRGMLAVACVAGVAACGPDSTVGGANEAVEEVGGPPDEVPASAFPEEVVDADALPPEPGAALDTEPFGDTVP